MKFTEIMTDTQTHTGGGRQIWRGGVDVAGRSQGEVGSGASADCLARHWSVTFILHH